MARLTARFSGKTRGPVSSDALLSEFLRYFIPPVTKLEVGNGILSADLLLSSIFFFPSSSFPSSSFVSPSINSARSRKRASSLCEARFLEGGKGRGVRYKFVRYSCGVGADRKQTALNVSFIGKLESGLALSIPF